MSKWVIDTEAVAATQLDEMERHYDRWWSITTTLDKMRMAQRDDDEIKIRAPDTELIKALEEQQQAAYDAYTSLAGGLVHKADPFF